MKITTRVTCTGLLALTSVMIPFLSAEASVPPAAITTKQQELSAILKAVMPAVVNVSVQGEIVTPINPFAKDKRQHDNEQPPAKRFAGFGSAVIVDAKKGYILTNAHVIHDAKFITITIADGRVYRAKLIGEDIASDIAVLQIKADNLVAMPLGNSDDLQVGQPVAAIGNPFGFTQTVTSGIVSALQRSDLKIEKLEDFIQTDAPINPGNSGGALVDMSGNLIGINTAIFGPDGANVGIGFAIPANMARSIMEQLIQYGEVRRGVLGVTVQNLTPDLANALSNLTPGLGQQFKEAGIQGAIVDTVVPGSPAERAGLKVGDIIRKINGKVIKTGAAIRNTIGLLRIGSKIDIDVLRAGKPLTLHTSVLDPREQDKQQNQSKELISGITLQNIAVQDPIHGYIEGVLVVGVSEDSAAWHWGLFPGDVIVSANLKPVHNINELNAIAKQSQVELLLNILRGPISQFIVIK